MRIDLPVPEAWDSICDAYRTALKLDDPRIAVQVFNGYQHALWEATQGLARLFSHKKTIVVLGTREPAIEAVALAFSAEGFTVKYLSADEASSDAAAVEALQAELLFVLYAKDDPITGRLYDLSAFEAATKEKRIFRIVLSHSAHRFPVWSDRPAPFEVRILSLAPERALIVAGERFRVTPLLTQSLPWLRLNEQVIKLDLFKYTLEQQQELTAKLKVFEADLPCGFQPYFASDPARLPDRAVIFHTEIDGSAFMDRIARRLSLELEGPGGLSPIETMSGCRWRSPRLHKWLIERGDNPEQLRGLVLIAVRLLSDDASYDRRVDSGSDTGGDFGSDSGSDSGGNSATNLRAAIEEETIEIMRLQNA